MTNKVWELRYIVGNPKMFTRVTDADGSPMSRAEALKGFETIANNGWAVWVEHAVTGERIAESEAEKQRQEAQKDLV